MSIKSTICIIYIHHSTLSTRGSCKQIYVLVFINNISFYRRSVVMPISLSQLFDINSISVIFKFCDEVRTRSQIKQIPFCGNDISICYVSPCLVNNN